MTPQPSCRGGKEASTDRIFRLLPTHLNPTSRIPLSLTPCFSWVFKYAIGPSTVLTVSLANQCSRHKSRFEHSPARSMRLLSTPRLIIRTPFELDSHAKKVIQSANALARMTSDALNILAIGTAPVDPLSGAGFRCEKSPTVSAGLERLTKERIDLVLLNFNATDEWNLEPFAKIHGAFLHIPIVLVTESSHEEAARKALLLGAQDYVYSTDLPAATLAAVIRKSILLHRSQLTSRRDRHLPEILMQKFPVAIY